MEISNKTIFLTIAFVVLSALFFLERNSEEPSVKKEVSREKVQKYQDEVMDERDVASTVKDESINKIEQPQKVETTVVEKSSGISIEEDNLDTLRKEAAHLTPEDLNSKIHALRAQIQVTTSREQRQKLRRKIRIYRQQRFSMRMKRIRRN